MKNGLIAATALGAAIAGLILYYQRKNPRTSNRVLDAAKDAYDTMNNGIGKLERPAQHAMG